MERRWSPAAPWTRAKMTPGKFEAMVGAIVGFEVEPRASAAPASSTSTSRRTTRGTIAGQRGAGRQDIAAAIRGAALRP